MEEIRDQALRRQREEGDENDIDLTNSSTGSRKRLKSHVEADDDIKETLKNDIKARQEIENKMVIHESKRIEMDEILMQDENERFHKLSTEVYRS